MNIHDILQEGTVTKFPKKKRSYAEQIFGYTSSGLPMYADEITGLPYVKNKHDVAFQVDPKTNEPINFDAEQMPQQDWFVVDDDTGKALAIFSSKKEADQEAEKFRRWHKKNVSVIMF